MRTITVKIAAGAQESIGVVGDYVRVRLAPSDVIIETENGEKFDASQGDDFELKPFDTLRVTNIGGSDAFFKFTVALGKKAGASQVSGSVSITSQPAINTAGANSTATVGTSSASLVAVDATRKYLAIYNRSRVATVYINFAGTATAADLPIKPGGSFVCEGNMMTAAVAAISNGVGTPVTIIKG